MVSRKRWTTLFCDDDNRSPTDLREALKSEQGNTCGDGLRSICWKVRYNETGGMFMTTLTMSRRFCSSTTSIGRNGPRRATTREVPIQRCESIF